MKATQECSVPQCERLAEKRGWCGRHYLRWHRTGTPDGGRDPIPFREDPSEHWIPVPGYEGLYEVSDHGRVKSVARVVQRAAGHTTTIRERILRQSKERYPNVNLSKDGEVSRARLHTLVLTAFCGPAPQGMYGLHADDNGSNNHLSNLRWGTQSENGYDRWRHHRRRDGGGFKLTADQAREIIVAVRGGEMQKDVAERFGVSGPCVSLIVSGKNWKHLQSTVEVVPAENAA